MNEFGEYELSGLRMKPQTPIFPDGEELEHGRPGLKAGVCIGV